MRPYADVPSRRMAQIAADVIAVLAILLFIRIGVGVHEKVASLAVWGERIQTAGERLGNSLTNIGDTLSGIPLVGELISGPFNNAATAAGEWEEVGADISAQISSFAVVLGVLVAIGPILFILVIWLVPRLRFALRAARVHDIAKTPAGLDLLALRALAGAPVKDLQELSPDIADRWRERDLGAIGQLAELELSRSGLRFPKAKAKAAPAPDPTPIAPPPPPAPPVAAAPEPVAVTARVVPPKAPAKAPAKPAPEKPAPAKPAAQKPPAKK